MEPLLAREFPTNGSCLEWTSNPNNIKDLYLSDCGSPKGNGGGGSGGSQNGDNSGGTSDVDSSHDAFRGTGNSKLGPIIGGVAAGGILVAAVVDVIIYEEKDQKRQRSESWRYGECSECGGA